MTMTNLMYDSIEQRVADLKARVEYAKKPCAVCGESSGNRPTCYKGEEYCCENHLKELRRAEACMSGLKTYTLGVYSGIREVTSVQPTINDPYGMGMGIGRAKCYVEPVFPLADPGAPKGYEDEDDYPVAESKPRPAPLAHYVAEADGTMRAMTNNPSLEA